MGDKQVVDLTHASIQKKLQKQIGEKLQKLSEYEKSKISPEEYSKGVRILVEFISHHPTTGGAKVCASVLLSTYNGSEFHVNLASLGNLDFELYRAALAVIRGRVECGKEPQQMIAGGANLFPRLWKEYQHLTVTNRAKQRCNHCHGDGKLYRSDEDYDQGRGESCWRCEGRGWSWPEQ